MKRILLIIVAIFIPTCAFGKVFPSPQTTQTEVSIPAIRQRYAAINRGTGRYRRVKKELAGFSAEGGELVAYFDGPRIVKITGEYFGEGGRSTEEFYYSNEQLIFVFRQEHTYDKPLSGKIVATQSNRFYFGNDRLIRWIDEKGKTQSSESEDYRGKQQEFLETSNKFLKAARSSEPTIEARGDETSGLSRHFTARSRFNDERKYRQARYN